MTGHGEAHRHEDGLSIAVEIRTVNNRYFKLNLRADRGLRAARAARRSRSSAQQIRRGTVQVNLQIDREPRPDDYRLNQAVLARLPAAARSGARRASSAATAAPARAAA